MKKISPQPYRGKWFIPETIPQNTPFMMSIPLQFMVQEYPKYGLGNSVKYYFTWFDKDLSKMCYMRKEFDAQSDYISKKMLANPDWALKIIGNIEQYSKDCFAEAKKFRALRFGKMTNAQMASAFKKPFRWHRLSQGFGTAVSFYADADKERVTKAILEMLTMQISRHNLQLIPAVVFSTLSTPSKESILKQEEKALLRLAVKKVGTKTIATHAKRYEWVNYQYKGPVFELSYFTDRLEALRSMRANPAKMLKEISDQDAKTRAEQKALLKLLRLSRHQTKLIKMAQALVFIKDYRKEAVYHAMYSYEPFFREIGRRFGLSIDQVRAMNWWEILDLLKTGKKTDIDHLNGRLKFAMGYVTPQKYEYYVGEEAKQFLRDVKFEQNRKKFASEFLGTCAYPGKVRGKVKIVNVPEDMSKMRKGDILVAHNTNPNLVPAMKKASAMVSAAGGLTCHTAIVARELKIPTVVGVENIDEILKDGTRIEVNATEGTVKKL